MSAHHPFKLHLAGLPSPNQCQPHLLQLSHFNYCTDMLHGSYGSGVHFVCHVKQKHTQMLTCTDTDTNTCRAITILMLPAAQLHRVSVLASRLSIKRQNIERIMQCGWGGAVRSAFQSQHLTGFCLLPCTFDTCLI